MRNTCKSGIILPILGSLCIHPHQQIRQLVILGDRSRRILPIMESNGPYEVGVVVAACNAHDSDTYGISHRPRHPVTASQGRPERLPPTGSMVAALYVASSCVATTPNTKLRAVVSVGGLLSIGLKPGQNANERILLLAFAFAPDFMLLSASWEPFFLWNFTAILLCWMYLEHSDAATTNATAKPNGTASASYRALGLPDIYRGLVFLFLVHAVSSALTGSALGLTTSNFTKGFFCTGNVASIS
jgi:hypothetical protein